MPGHTNSRQYLQALSDKLEASVIAWDYPGHGTSDEIRYKTPKKVEDLLNIGIHSMLELLIENEWETNVGCRCFGCIPTAWLAGKYNFNSVIMVSPVTSFEQLLNYQLSQYAEDGRGLEETAVIPLNGLNVKLSRVEEILLHRRTLFIQRKTKYSVLIT